MPEFIEVDISGLDLGKSIKVEDLLNEEFDILNSPVVSVVSVNIPRVKIEIEEEEEEGEEGAEGAEGAEGVTEGGEKKEGGSEGASEGGDKKEEKKDS
jgi:large subunit ribosomal protein L25